MKKSADCKTVFVKDEKKTVPENRKIADTIWKRNTFERKSSSTKNN